MASTRGLLRLPDPKAKPKKKKIDIPYNRWPVRWRRWVKTFIILAILSCLFIAKDEWVHARLCSGGEQWLHALLFVLHPLLFIAAWILWKSGETGWLAAQMMLTASFMLYQTVYWNFIRAS